MAAGGRAASALVDAAAVRRVGSWRGSIANPPAAAGAPGLDEPAKLKAFFAAMQKLNAARRIIAYHDRSDGGLFATLCEMAFAGRTGLTVYLDKLAFDARTHDVDGHERQTDVLQGNLADRVLAALFSEELGAVLQVRKEDRAEVIL